MSFNSLSDAQKERLSLQQDSIINSSSTKVYVSAGPGSGKTHTISEKIRLDIDGSFDYQGVIACSFTKEAARELENRVERLTSTKTSIIKTLDSFVLTEVINPFLNRYLYLKDEDKHKQILKLEISFPKGNERIKEVNNLTRLYDGEKSWKDIPTVKNYVMNWYSKFKKGKYEISFPSYIIASDYLSRLDILTDYFESRFTSIYIDEAQDLNAFQHLFLRTLVEKCKLNIVMIGDGNQSIYAFRGAKPQIFRGLPDLGYDVYNIDISVRCHDSILALAYLLFDNKRKIQVSENRIYIGGFLTSDFLRTLKENYMILVESKAKAKELYYDYVSKGLDITYSESINYDSEALIVYKDEYMEFIEESILFYYNSDNEDFEMIYSHDDYIDFIENSGFNTKKIKNSLYKEKNENVIEFLSRLSKILDFEFSGKLLEELRKELSNPIIYSHYYRKKKVNRIMTFHSSKGLESENVITVFQYNQYNIGYEYLRKCFVGFTRAKNNLYINFVDQAIGSKNEKYIKQLYQNVLASVQK